MAPHIQTPVKGFTGTVVGVDFKNGVGETDDEAALAYFGRHGYKIETAGAEGKAKGDQKPAENPPAGGEGKEQS